MLNNVIITNVRGQKVKTIDVDGASAEYLYDRDGNRLDETDSYGNTAMFPYDEARGNTTAFGYDAWGNLSTVKDSLNGETTYIYDACGNVIKEQLADGNETTYTSAVLGTQEDMDLF